jgi:hypothetical protein
VDLHAVKAGLVHGVAGGRRVQPDVLLDLFEPQRARRRLRRAEFDVGCRDEVEARVFALQDVQGRGATECPELEEDEGSLRVDGVRDLHERRQGVNARSKGRYVPASTPRSGLRSRYRVRCCTPRPWQR